MSLFVEKSSRLDQFLAEKYPDFSRSYFQKLIQKGLVLVNGEKIKKGQKLKIQDEVEVEFLIEEELRLEPEYIPLQILYEDDDLLAINKPEGMVVHPAPGHRTKTFANALVYHLKKNPFNDNLRPGIVHRLDKDTTGVLLAAKHLKSQVKLVNLFSERKMHKKYNALCLGTVQNQTINMPIGRDPKHRQKMKVIESGKEALSIVKTLGFDDTLSFVEVEIKTGRTHQIRVHLKQIGHPILGDSVYGNTTLNKKLKATRLFLHARVLSFIHPFSNQKITIEAPLPKDFEILSNS